MNLSTPTPPTQTVSLDCMDLPSEMGRRVELMTTKKKKADFY